MLLLFLSAIGHYLNVSFGLWSLMIVILPLPPTLFPQIYQNDGCLLLVICIGFLAGLLEFTSHRSIFSQSIWCCMSLKKVFSKMNLYPNTQMFSLVSTSGESAVGKSSLVLRFVKGQFHEYQESTIGGMPVLIPHLHKN